MADSTKVGNAGEHLVMAELLARGFHAFRADRSNSAYDLAVFSGKKHSLIRVKTTTSDNLQWTAKPDGKIFLEMKASGDFVAIVVMKSRDDPIRKSQVFLVPTSVVDREIRKCHDHWHSHPGRQGRVRKRTNHRGLGLSGNDTPTNIAHGYATKWAKYIDGWSQLK